MGKGVEAVEHRERSGVALEEGNEAKGVLCEFVVKAGLKRQDSVLRTEDFLLIFLQLLGNVALGLGKRLLANPFGRHVVLIRVAHLNIITEDIVETNLQTGNARLLTLTLLHLQEVILTRSRNGAQVVEFFVYATPNDTPFSHQGRRVKAKVVENTTAEFFATVEAQTELANVVVGSGSTGLFQACHAVERHAQLLHFAGIDAPHGNF